MKHTKLLTRIAELEAQNLTLSVNQRVNQTKQKRKTVTKQFVTVINSE